MLEDLYKRGLKGEQIAPALYKQPNFLMFWATEPVASWQDEGWLEQMRSTLRSNAFLRMIRNQWVRSESTFIEMNWWDSCVDNELRPALNDSLLPIWCGIDASTKRDSAAIAVCTFDSNLKKIRPVWHRIFQPSLDDPLDFGATIEDTMLGLNRRFWLRGVYYDPYQMQATAQRLTAARLPMMEYAQTISNLTESSTNLYELVKGRNLVVYSDGDIRLAISRTVAIETSRGWKISKEKVSDKIDIVVALAMAALGAVRGGQTPTLRPTEPQSIARSIARIPSPYEYRDPRQMRMRCAEDDDRDDRVVGPGGGTCQIRTGAFRNFPGRRCW